MRAHQRAHFPPATHKIPARQTRPPGRDVRLRRFHSFRARDARSFQNHATSTPNQSHAVDLNQYTPPENAAPHIQSIKGISRDLDYNFILAIV